MVSQRLAGILWLIAGISGGGIAFFLVDLLDLAIFIGGAVLAVLLALAMLVRPSPSWVTWSNLARSGVVAGLWRGHPDQPVPAHRAALVRRLDIRVRPRRRSCGVCAPAAGRTGLTSARDAPTREPTGERQGRRSTSFTPQPYAEARES
jgi:hypothetical protein